MDQTNPSSPNTQTPSTPHQVTPPATTCHPLSPVVFMLFGIFLGATGLWTYQNYSPFQIKQTTVYEKPIPETTPTTTPTITVILTPTPNPTTNWNSFTSPTQKIFFKYPQSWNLTSTPGQNDKGNIINESVKLTNGQATISMYFNMDGIGGLGRDYEGTPISVDGQTLYEYKMIQTDFKKVTIGLTDDLTESLGVFRHNEKTYSITLTYPDSYENTGQSADLQIEFNQLLSTFKFN